MFVTVCAVSIIIFMTFNCSSYDSGSVSTVWLDCLHWIASSSIYQPAITEIQNKYDNQFNTGQVTDKDIIFGATDPPLSPSNGKTCFEEGRKQVEFYLVGVYLLEITG